MMKKIQYFQVTNLTVSQKKEEKKITQPPKSLSLPPQIAYGQKWPVFGFEKHKGYGTAGHRDAIREHGTVEIHRRSFLKKMEAAGGKLSEYKERPEHL